jgi:hypothetical protein
VVGILQETPELASLEILRRVREVGYEGGKTALYALVASLRPKLARPLVRFEGLPGEFSQHDFGEVEVEFLNGARQRIHFFASRLKYSRLVRVSLVKDETVESLVRTLAEHLASWGGRPLLCVFDRPKTIALKWRRNGEVTEWNPVFAYATLEMGVGVELCWPYRASPLGSVFGTPDEIGEEEAEQLLSEAGLDPEAINERVYKRLYAEAQQFRMAKKELPPLLKKALEDLRPLSAPPRNESELARQARAGIEQIVEKAKLLASALVPEAPLEFAESYRNKHGLTEKDRKIS